MEWVGVVDGRGGREKMEVSIYAPFSDHQIISRV